MMIIVEINNRQKIIELDDKTLQLITEVGEKAAADECPREGELSITLVDNKEIHSLNKKYRRVDKVTDVLSFPVGEEILGDIIISVERAKVQAEEYGHSLQRELCYLLTHGILHLCGYSHKNKNEKEKMRKREEEILAEFDLGRE